MWFSGHVASYGAVINDTVPAPPVTGDDTPILDLHTALAVNSFTQIVLVHRRISGSLKGLSAL